MLSHRSILSEDVHSGNMKALAEKGAVYNKRFT